jgi:hypothetical protein
MKSRKPKSALTRRAFVGLAAAASVLPACRPSLAQAALPPSFEAGLKTCGLVFDSSGLQNFAPARILPNPHVTYEYAVRHLTRPVEIRYILRGNAGVKDKAGFALDLTVYMKNMTRKDPASQRDIHFEYFKDADVRDEFNADIGASGIFMPDPTFAVHTTGLCSAICNYKTGSLAFVVFLFQRGPEGMSNDDTQIFMQSYHTIRFA